MAYTTVIGIDCATKARKTGLARARLEAGRWRLTDVTRGSANAPPAERVVSWIDDGEPTLLALDAPLGWPAPLSRELVSHTAGTAIPTAADEMFSRATDRYVQRVHGKRPLEVGAARIARTARAALLLLDELRRETGREIPLAWNSGPTKGVAAIEVYPAVTRKVHLEAAGMDPSGDSRADILAVVGRTVAGHDSLGREDATPDELDAALCVVAGIDFVVGAAVPPEDLDLAEREGWIWVRRPGDGTGPT